MNNNIHFIHAGTLHDQTHLVDALLKEESETKSSCQWYNHLVFHLELTEETFTGSFAELELRVKEMRTQLDSMKKQLEEDDTLADTMLYRSMLSRINKDIDILVKAQGKKVAVFQWLLVPYWLSEKLVTVGEVILRVYGSNWWGVASLGNQSFILEKVIKELKTE